MNRLNGFALAMMCTLVAVGSVWGQTATQRIRGDVVALHGRDLEVKTGTGQVVTVRLRGQRPRERAVGRQPWCDHARHISRHDRKAAAGRFVVRERGAYLSGIDARHRRRSSSDGHGTGQHDDQCHGDQRRSCRKGGPGQYNDQRDGRPASPPAGRAADHAQVQGRRADRCRRRRGSGRDGRARRRVNARARRTRRRHRGETGRRDVDVRSGLGRQERARTADLGDSG